MKQKVIPNISVLMTAYNREKYIAEAIESVLASTYHDFELIIVDDCSNDKTFEIAKLYEAKDSRIKVYINESNLGDYPNRNKAASYAKGKYLKYLDSDDIMYPHCLDVMVNAMEQFPNSALGLSSNVKQLSKPFPFELNPHDTLKGQFEKMGFLDIGPTGIIFNRISFENMGGFSGKRFYGDTELLLKMSDKFNVVLLSSSLVYWRVHSEQEFKIEHETGENWGRTDLIINFLENNTTSLDLNLRKRYIKNLLLINTNVLIKNTLKKISLSYFFKYYKYTVFNYQNFKRIIIGFK